jgi:3-hydroxyacyl-[acyl-carrier-protein] dehydratase
MKFRMVDQIIGWEPGRSITGIKAVSFEEYRCRAALGAAESLPESLVLESLLQLGNWLLVLSSDYVWMGLVRDIERAEFHSALRPGERMRMEVSSRGGENGSVLLDGRGSVDGREVVRVEAWRAEYCPLAQYMSADDLRVLFSEIHHPPGGKP